MLGQNLGRQFADANELFSMDAHVGGLALHAAGRLMNENARIRQGKTFSLGAGGQQQGSH